MSSIAIIATSIRIRRPKRCLDAGAGLGPGGAGFGDDMLRIRLSHGVETFDWGSEKRRPALRNCGPGCQPVVPPFGPAPAALGTTDQTPGPAPGRQAGGLGHCKKVISRFFSSTAAHSFSRRSGLAGVAAVGRESERLQRPAGKPILRFTPRGRGRSLRRWCRARCGRPPQSDAAVAVGR